MRRKARRNPAPSWFKQYEMRGDVVTEEQHRAWLTDFARRIGRRVSRTADGLSPDASARERRESAARLTADLALIDVVTLSGAWNYRGDKSQFDWQEMMDAYAAKLAPIVDAKNETILGRWSGSLRHTTLPPTPQASIDEARNAAEEAANTSHKEVKNDLLRLQRAANVLLAYLVDFDDETGLSFYRVERKALRTEEQRDRFPHVSPKRLKEIQNEALKRRIALARIKRIPR